jgi:hypothetical protein
MRDEGWTDISGEGWGGDITSECWGCIPPA